MLLELFIAKKQIFEHKKQSFIGIIGIAIGIAVLVVSLGISNGLSKNMIDSVLSLSSHITMTNYGDIKNPKQYTDKLVGIKEIKGVVPKVKSQSLIRYSGVFGEYVSGVKIEGIDFDSGASVLELDKKIVKGKIDKKNLKGVLIGNELFKQLGAKVGDKITVVSAQNKELPLTIAGAFQSGFYDYDLSLIILPLKTAQYLTERDDSVSTIDIFLKNPYSADKILNTLEKKTKLYGRSWGDMNQNLLKAIALEKAVMVIGFSMIILIAVFVVWIILNTMIREKRKYIGIMRSMGISNKSIVKIFLFQGVTIGIIGIILGVIISLLILWYIKTYSLPYISNIYYLTKLPVEISVDEILKVVAFNLILIVISSIFPAYRAGKLKIVEALKNE